MLFFKSRDAARAFAARTNRVMTDCGSDASVGRRWAVAVVVFDV